MQSHSGILASTPLKAKIFKNSKNFQPYERAAVELPVFSEESFKVVNIVYLKVHVVTSIIQLQKDT